MFSPNCTTVRSTSELNRLERKGPFPVTIIVADLNGLKAANDQWGHAAGDALLRRAGEVLNEVIGKTLHAARIGGDEFAILMPAADERDGQAMMDNINKLVEINNQFYSGLILGLSMGVATSRPAGGGGAARGFADVQGQARLLRRRRARPPRGRRRRLTVTH